MSPITVCSDALVRLRLMSWFSLMVLFSYIMNTLACCFMEAKASFTLMLFFLMVMPLALAASACKAKANMMTDEASLVLQLLRQRLFLFVSLFILLINYVLLFDYNLVVVHAELQV